MKCNGCGNTEAYIIRCTKDDESCNSCGGIALPWLPDVSFRGAYLDPNLGHPSRPHERDGVMVYSKRHKETLLREQGLREVGDKRHGARNEL